MSSSPFTAEASAAIDRRIEEYFEAARARAQEISPSYVQLWKQLQALIQSGGKRLRPHMTVLAYEAFGGTVDKPIISVAVAQEFLHFSLLIHDDIIDRDYIRYGTPNIAGHYATTYRKYAPDINEHTHYANSAALLGGDLMLSAAHHLIASSGMSGAKVLLAQDLLAESVFQVAGGELLDTEASFISHLSDHALKIAYYKTASYSFLMPLLTGAQLAGITKRQAAALRAFALSLGIAYQLVDDLLGVFGHEEETGKSTSSDIREGKHTYMVEQAVKTMSTEDKIVFNLAFGNQHATTEAITQAKELLVSSGARAKAKELIARHKADALQVLPRCSLPPAYEQKFRQLVSVTTERSA